MADHTALLQAPSTKPKMVFFRKQYGAAKLSPECARRQGEITRLAFNFLGGRDAAISFLNCNDELLGGRPLDLAIASAEGHAAVVRVITERASTSGLTEL